MSTPVILAGVVAHTKKKKDKNKTKATKKPVQNTDSSEVLNNLNRLSPDEIMPSHYTICIKPNFEDFSFEGCVAVSLEIRKETKYILMNALDMTITKVMWEEDVTENKQEPMEFGIDQEKQVLRIYFEPPLLPNTGALRVNFNGLIGSKLIGLYRSKYTVDGVEGVHLVTKFEPTYARMCFPCWDEPSFKATFDLSLILAKDLTAISNMPIKLSYAHRSKPWLHIVEFDRTPLMSTYLLAFAVGTFDYLEFKPEFKPILAPDMEIPKEKSKAPVPVRIYTVPGKKEHAAFALDTCVKLLAFYRNYFDFAYPLPKLDMIAVTDFITGGVENWGLISCKESRLLLSENEQSFKSKKQVVVLIAHELAHQWLGNLVTMEWWTHLWLSEGFATYMEFVAIDHLFPGYDIWTLFYTDTFLQVLQVDGLKNSHPLEVVISHPSEIKEIFDHISYNKGASILSMLKRMIGERTFRKALNIYLTKYKYKNATTNNLWKVFEAATNKPIGSVMSSWSRKQMGFPLIRITATKYEENNRIITLTQEKYWSDPVQRDIRSLNKDYLWLIPLTFTVGSNPGKIVKEVLMEKRTLIVTLPNIARSQWFKLNPGGVGYYRVKYLPEMMQQFHQAIRSRTMPPLDRVGILNDLYAFVQSGLNSTMEMFNLLEAYGDEDNYTVWTQISAVLDGIDRLLWDTDYSDKFNIFCRMSLNAVMEKVGWQYGDHDEASKINLRALILSRMVLTGHEETLTIAEQRFRAHLSGEEIERVELRSVIYQGAFIKGDTSDTLKLLIKRYKETESIEEKECIIYSFNAITNPDVIHDALEFSVSEHVRPSEMKQIVQVLARTKAGRDLAWLFFKSHHNQLKAMLYPGVAYGQLIEAITENFTSEAKAVEVHEYFRDKLLYPGLERTILQVEEKIRINEAWLKRESAFIQDYLSTYE